MKRIISFLVSLFLFLSVLPLGYKANAEDTTIEKEHLIIKYKEGQNLSETIKDNLNIESQSKNGELELIEISAEDVEEIIGKLEARDEVEYVEENTTYHIATDETKTTGKDTYLDNQWNLTAIDAEGAWNEMKDVNGEVVVAVLDTGISFTHEDLVNRQNKGETFITTSIGTTVNGEDDHGHGTFVSGIVAAEANNAKGISGVVGESNIKILPIKVMNKSGSGEAMDVAVGIQYAIEKKVDVINLSLSGKNNKVVADAVAKAIASGIVVVAAAGNGGGSADASFPAALDNVISVGSVAIKDQSIGSGSGRSNVGETLDVVAPGVNVTSTSLKGDLGKSDTGNYTTGTGTSYATPHVAAVAALYKMKHPDATVAKFDEALKESALDLDSVGRDDKTGYGRIDAKKTLAYESKNKISFSSPKKNADVMGDIPLSINLIETDVKKIEFKVGGKVVDTVDVIENNATLTLDTTKYEDGELEIIATALNAAGESVQQLSTSVTVRNNAQSGYMFNVKAPNGELALGSTVKLFEKKDDKYTAIWSGITDLNGTVRVAGNVGTDLKDLKVVVQGKFDNSKSAFIYSRDVSSNGSVELKAENVQKVTLNTKERDNTELRAQYYVTLKDENGIAINGLGEVNSNSPLNPDDLTEGSRGATLYADKGIYNLISYATKGDETYFLTNSEAKITDSTVNFTFETTDASEVKIDNVDNALENAILYLYNDDMNEALGEDTFKAGSKFYVTPGEYFYIIDAEVKSSTKDADKGNWIYYFREFKEKAKVIKGKVTNIKVGGEINLYPFTADQASVKQYSINRGVEYIERTNPLDAYITDQAFYTKQKFQDAYGNILLGMQRGTLAGNAGTMVKKEVNTGETTVISDNGDSKIQAKDFGTINPTFKVTRKSDGKLVSMNSARLYYTNVFFLLTGQDMTKGYYDLNISTIASPLMPKGISESLTMNLKDSATIMKVKDNKGVSTKAYVTLNIAVKDISGDVDWKQIYGRNTDTKKNELTIPNTLGLSKENQGNVAVIRYLIDGRYAYFYKKFNKIEDLSTVEIPDNMQELKINLKDGDQVYDKIGTKLWKFKKTFKIDGEDSYLTVNNYQVYKYDSFYIEPGEFMIEGNYVSLPNEKSQKDNLYFLETFNVVEKEKKEANILNFDKAKLAKVKIEANTDGFTDLRGALVYPYNEYSDSFTSTLRTGHNFYFPTNLKMNIQVQLGYGDTENKEKIWNYFMTKGDQIFKPGQGNQVWKVGGNLSTRVHLEKTNFAVGSELKGTTEILDAHQNKLSSILVDSTAAFSTAAFSTAAFSTAANHEREVEYKLNKSGQIEKLETEVESQISHSTVPEAASNSVKPVISILDAQNQVISKASSLSYYTYLRDLVAPLQNGSYKIQLQIAGSPLGVTTSQETFTVGENIITPRPTETSPEEPNPQKNNPEDSVSKEPTLNELIPQKNETNDKEKQTLILTVGVISDKTTILTGKTTAQANVSILNGGEILASTTANENGEYKLEFAKQKAGSKLSVVAKLGEQEVVKMITVTDKTSPLIISVIANDSTKKVKIKTEAKVKIELFIKGEKYSKMASKTGEATLIIKRQKAGTKWKVKVSDSAGNHSTESGKVLDRTAPKKPLIFKKITIQMNVIKGRAEKYSIVTIYRAGEEYRSVKVNSKGMFKVEIEKQKYKTKLIFYATDLAGNRSKGKSIKVKK